MFGVKSKPVVILAWIFVAIMALLPFHAVLSTWAISNFGHVTLFKAWKELLLFFVAAPLLAWILYTDEAIRKKIFSSRINLLILLFAGLALLMIPLTDNGKKAELAGLVFNLRFLGMFILAQVLALKFVKDSFREFTLRIIFFGGMFVVAFGTLQVLLLPHDFLRHLGYQKDIIPPYFTVDNNQNYIRIISTLRGPNALGAYLVFWLPFLALVTKRMWNVATKYRVYAAGIWAMSLITLFGSRSRSAWIGVLLAGCTLVFLQANAAWRKKLALAAGVGLIVVVAAIALGWNTTFVQTNIRHHDPTDVSKVDSDVQHQSSLSIAVQRIKDNPLGTGVGSANLASTYGNKPNIVENYYLQVAEEVGIFGLLVFVAILVLVAMKLWQLRQHDIAAALLAGFVGIAFVNLLLPAWGDETLSMLWWGMAGLIMFAKISTKHNKSAKV